MAHECKTPKHSKMGEKISKSVRISQQRGESRPTVIGAGENAEPSVRVERHLTEGRHVSGVEPLLPGLDRASAPGGPSWCSVACHACPSHAAALRRVTLTPSLKRQGGFVMGRLVSR